MDIRDLLVRHEKLVHLNEGSKDNRARKASSVLAQQDPRPDGRADPSVLGMQHAVATQQTFRPEPAPPPPLGAAAHPHNHNARISQRNAGCNLDLLSDAALASAVNPTQPMVPGFTHHTPAPATNVRIKPIAYGDQGAYSARQREEPAALSAGFVSQTASMSFDDYNFFDDIASSSHFLPPPYDPEQQLGGWPAKALSKPGSRFASRLPSVQPDQRNFSGDGVSSSSTRPLEDQSRVPPFRISPGEHTVLKGRVEEFSSVLPNGFIFPSRHTLIRFVEGYANGFHEQLPFLHLPTLSLVEVAPELLLAILSVGAQCRFESQRGYALWYAAKAVAFEQTRRRQSPEVLALLPTSAAYSPHSTRPSPSAGHGHGHGHRHSLASAPTQDRPIARDAYREPFSPGTIQSRIESIQALLLLFSVGLWGPSAILNEALSLQSYLAMLLREDGLSSDTSQSTATDWEMWIRLEGVIRTKLMAYCLFNLCSVAYGTPPLLLTSEFFLHLPQPSRFWKAETAWQWQERRQTLPPVDITLHEAFSRLFGRPAQGIPGHISSLGHYVLIHALLQHIYLLKQTTLSTSQMPSGQRSLRNEDVEDITHALRVWQMTFEHGNQMRAAAQAQGGFFGSDGFPGGPMAFNSTALLRLAYIRLCADVVPRRGFETRSHVVIAAAINEGSVVDRGLRLQRALIQAMHALSVLVKAGVNYVARAKSSEWSIQHSLCNFECAVLVSKWLLTLSSLTHHDPPPTPEERNLLETVRRLLDETEFGVPLDVATVDGGPNDGLMLRQLSAAVVRLWAEAFKGSHIFEVVRVMGNSLDGYGDLVEKPGDRTPVRTYEVGM
ncbi:related to regulatory protein amdA [Cephalotrichum gorgonifer]|uniref:Related to regulatory protein amdA n=1 Tax=Cephalotrichum gorgonifer TaxID=2041049 RepID=A0AAE8SXN8_9PEZI|nr:related to regulatory protein amdA [Cephalotrichum gorgonifer]